MGRLVIALLVDIDRCPAPVAVRFHDHLRGVEGNQAKGPGTYRPQAQLTPVALDRLARHHGSVALRECERQLRKRADQANLQGVRIERAQAFDIGVVVRAGILPLVDAQHAALPQPGPLRTHCRVEVTLDRVNHVLRGHFAALTVRKRRVVDEPHAAAQTDGIGQTIVGDFRHCFGEVGLEFVGLCQVLVGVQRVVNADYDQIGVRGSRLHRVQRGRRTVGRMAIDAHAPAAAESMLFSPPQPASSKRSAGDCECKHREKVAGPRHQPGRVRSMARSEISIQSATVSR